jgi:hypothetical protein
LRTRQIDKNSIVIEFVYPACLKATEHIGYINLSTQSCRSIKAARV